MKPLLSFNKMLVDIITRRSTDLVKLSEDLSHLRDEFVRYVEIRVYRN